MRLDFELPSFSALVKIAETEHDGAERALYVGVEQRLSDADHHWLDELLAGDLPARQTRYNALKRSAKNASRQHLAQLLEQLHWLESLPHPDVLLDGTRRRA